MMMMRKGWITELRAEQRAVPSMAMLLMTARVRRTPRAVGKRPGKGLEHRMGRGNYRRLRTGKGKGRGRGRETVKGKVLLNKPQGEMIFLMPLLCSCRRNCERQTWTRRGS
jgi:hypothetical protein